MGRILAIWIFGLIIIWIVVTAIAAVIPFLIGLIILWAVLKVLHRWVTQGKGPTWS